MDIQVISLPYQHRWMEFELRAQGFHQPETTDSNDDSSELATPFTKAGWRFIPLDQQLPAWEPGPRNLYGLLARSPDGNPVVCRNQFLVLFEASVTEEGATAAIEGLDFTIVRSLNFAYEGDEKLPFFEVTVPIDPEQDLKEQLVAAAMKLEELDGVKWVETALEEELQLRQTKPLPNDLILHNHQWGWRTLGLLRAWTGNPDYRGRDVRIAVVDDGFLLDDEELQDKHDHIAYFDAREDLIGDTKEGMLPAAHGSACAFLAGGDLDNGFNGCGAAPESRLHLFGLGEHTTTQVLLARALAYVTDPQTEISGSNVLGVDVVTCSVGSTEMPWRRSATLELAIQFCRLRGRKRGTGFLGVPVFWATHNDSSEIPDWSVAGFDEVTAVSAMTQSGVRYDSGFGAALDFLAPGHRVWTFNQGGMGFAFGSSLAAPAVAGVVALMLEANSELKVGEIRSILEDTCHRPGHEPRHRPERGYGWPNALAAVAKAETMKKTTTPQPLADVLSAPPPADPANPPSPP